LPAGTIQIIPSAAIDAAGNISVTWYDNRGGAKNAAGDYLLDVYATTSSDGGLTFGNEFRINDTSFDPDLGAPDRFPPTRVLRIGEYNGLASVGGTADAVWTGNSSTGQQIVFGKFATGFQVISSTPAQGQLFSVPPTDFTVQLTNPVDTTLLQPSDFTVNGIAAVSTSVNAAGDAVTFHYNTSPATIEGLQSMAIAAGAISRQGDDAPLVAFAGTFFYDPQPLTVTSLSPANGALVTIPLTTLIVNFNEPINPSTAGTTDLTLSQGTVTAFTVLTGNQSVRYTISGTATQGTLSVALAMGALSDVNGNPSVAFAGSLQLDIVTAAAPVPLVAEPLLGSLIYDPSATGVINVSGDTDSFTLALDAGQTITVRVDPTIPGPATLAPTVTVLNPSIVSIGSASAAAGNRAVLQTAPVTAAGTYTITVGGAGGTIGNYTVQAFLNAALESESNSGPSNNTPATAQDLNPSFLTLQTSLASATRGAVVGQFGGDDDVYSFSLAAGQSASLAMSPSSTNPNLSTFGGLTNFPGADGPTSVAYGDFNRDGNLDMVVANSGGNGLDTTVGVRLGRGDGTFGPFINYSTGGNNPRYVAVGDINNDGKLDIVATNQNSNTVGVLLGNGDGTFGTATAYPVGSNPFGVAAIDINKDGRADVITTNFSSNTVTVYLGQANGTLSLAGNFAVIGTAPIAVAVGDVNKDGNADLVTANFNSSNISVLLGNGNGTFTFLRTVTAQSNPFGVALADFNGDTSLDVAVANQGSNTVSIIIGNGNGTFNAATNVGLNANGDGSGPRSIAVADVNHDGKLDIATANVNSATASLLLGNGDGTFATPVAYATATSPNTVALPDVNNDGLPDISTADFDGNSVSLRLNSLYSVGLQLLAPDGTTVLRTGAGTVNGSTAITGFVAPTAGTYYARATGFGTTNYDLVVTRDGSFESQSANPATSQDISGTSGVLGDVNNLAVVPAALASVETSSGNSFPFSTTMRYQQIYSHTEFALAGIIDAIRFRRSSGQGTFTSSPIDLKITLGYSARTVGAASSTFAENIGPGTVTVYDGLLTLSSNGANTLPRAFDVVVDLANLFYYDPTQGDLLLDITVRTAATTSFFLAVPALGQETTTTRIYVASTTPTTATTGTIGFISTDTRPYGLITRFDFVQPANDDSYTYNVTAANRGLVIETITPADGANQFVNTLNPNLELYDPSGNLVATGTAGPDGRNKSIKYVAATPGLYRIHVVGGSATTGEYFLGVTALPAPTPTMVIDNRGWGFQVYGAGWSLVSSGYNGDSRSHAGGGTGANYAEWRYGGTFTAGTSYEFYVTWVPSSTNATNATYKVLDGASILSPGIAVNETVSPSSVVFGGAVWQALYLYTPSTTGYHLIRIQLSDNANGSVSADALFDPPLTTAGVPIADPEQAQPQSPAVALAVLPSPPDASGGGAGAVQGPGKAGVGLRLPIEDAGPESGLAPALIAEPVASTVASSSDLPGNSPARTRTVKPAAGTSPSRSWTNRFGPRILLTRMGLPTRSETAADPAGSAPGLAAPASVVLRTESDDDPTT
jgi:hypothetical protein